MGVPMMAGQSKAGADAVIQAAGTLVRVPTPAFETLRRQGRHLPLLVARFSEALFQLVGQNAACNRLHTADQRLSRWLLMTGDRLEGDELPLTQEFLGQMLGVRRQSVTEAACELQDRGLIHYRRGHVSIINRPRLEATACECYAVMREVFDGLHD